VQFAGYTYQGAQNYHGGIAQQMNPDACPQCGGNQYFAKIRTKGRGPDPAGHCYNCGYNELFDQGDQASWGGGSPVVTTGDVQLAGIQVTASPWAGGLAPSE
jgi:predicted nucleic-acid-binding Zn-ribbon protein